MMKTCCLFLLAIGALLVQTAAKVSVLPVNYRQECHGGKNPMMCPENSRCINNLGNECFPNEDPKCSGFCVKRKPFMPCGDGRKGDPKCPNRYECINKKGIPCGDKPKCRGHCVKRVVPEPQCYLPGGDDQCKHKRKTLCIDDPSDKCNPLTSLRPCRGICVVPCEGSADCRGRQDCRDVPRDGCNPSTEKSCQSFCAKPKECYSRADCSAGQRCHFPNIVGAGICVPITPP